MSGPVRLADVQRLTGDYRAAVTSQQQALELYRDLGAAYGQSLALNQIGALQRLAGDYPAAVTSQQEALQLSRDLRARDAQGWALSELGLIQQLTGDHSAAATSHEEALAVFRDDGDRWGQAGALNDLGDLASRIAATIRARDHHNRALAIAAEIGAPLQKARALEGIGRSHLRDDTLARLRRPCGRHWRSTRTSEALALRASRKPCASIGSRRPDFICPVIRNRGRFLVRGGHRPEAEDRFDGQPEEHSDGQGEFEAGLSSPGSM
jgi:tetratricopeptide (TPR) repeat protein